MCRREVMDDFLRKREGLGANLVNGLFMKLEDPARATAPSPSTTTTRPTPRLAGGRWRLTS